MLELTPVSLKEARGYGRRTVLDRNPKTPKRPLPSGNENTL